MADIIRVGIIGTLPGGEVWSVNPVYKITSGAVITSTEATAIANAVNGVTVPAGLLGLMTTSTAITGCRIEARTHAGGLEAQAQALRTTPVAGSGTVNVLPYQSALVISLRTVGAGGRARGRLYWPVNSVQLTTATLRPLSTTIDTFLSAAKTYLSAIQTAVDDSVDETVGLAVWSRQGLSSALVIKLMAGDIIDTQRRRRDAIPETYKELVYV